MSHSSFAPLAAHLSSKPSRTSPLQRVKALYADGRAVRPGKRTFLNALMAAAGEGAHERGVHSGLDEQSLVHMLAGASPFDVTLDLDEYASLVADVVAPQTIDMAHRRCLAHMSGHPPPFMHDLADFIGRLNQNQVKVDASRMLSVVERRTLVMLHRLVYGRDAEPLEHPMNEAGPNGTPGLFTSGGSLANLAGLWCARAAAFPARWAFRSVERDGLAAACAAHGHGGAVIIGSELMHYSIDKAASLLGMGASAVIKVPVDLRLRMDIRALDEALAECAQRRLRVVALVGVAGTTDAASVDPLSEIAERARRDGLHFHVDAAGGLSAQCSATHRAKLAGIEQADSVSMDCHKQWLLPIGAGVLLLKDPHAARMLEQTAPYMLHATSRDLGKFSLEGSRPASALLVHAAMTVVGEDGFGAIVDNNHDMASRFAEMVRRSPDFELLHEPEGHMVLYRYVPRCMREIVESGIPSDADHIYLNAVCEALHRRQYREGASHVSLTWLNCLGRYRGTSVHALRAVFNHPLIDAEDLEAVLQDQRGHGQLVEMAVKRGVDETRHG